MRNAISYCAMRVAISGSPNSVELHLVQLRQIVQDDAGGVRVEQPGWIRKVQHRVADRAELDALIAASAEIRCPTGDRRAAGRLCPAPCDIITTNAGRSSRFAAQPVGHPGPDAGPAGDLRAGLEERDRRIVVDRLGVHRLDDAQLGRRFARCAAAARSPMRRTGRAARIETSTAPTGKLVLVGGHARQPLALADRIRQIRAAPLLQAAACSRTGPSATARRTETGRSPAWLSARNGESRPVHAMRRSCELARASRSTAWRAPAARQAETSLRKK